MKAAVSESWWSYGGVVTGCERLQWVIAECKSYSIIVMGCDVVAVRSKGLWWSTEGGRVVMESCIDL